MTLTAARASVTAQWLAEGRTVTAGLLIDSEGSSPLEPGAMMLIDGDDNVEGTVTGGCVEAAVLALAQQMRTDNEPTALATYGISDDIAGDVGLMCGGIVRILVHQISEPAAAVERAAAEAIAEGQPVALATLLDGEHAGAKLAVIDGAVIGTLESGGLLDASVVRDATGLISTAQSVLRSYGSDGAVLGSDLRVFVRVHAPRPRMILVGAIDFSAAIAPMARELGYAVTICDARETFVRSPRFARAATVVREWPDRVIGAANLIERDAVLVLTHDPKFDEPALIAALDSGAGYIGALGSRRTVVDRADRLRRAGIPDDQLERIYSPCGLDLGARGPEETAVSILAEIIALRTGRGAGHLRESGSRIHNDARSVLLR